MRGLTIIIAAIMVALFIAGFCNALLAHGHHHLDCFESHLSKAIWFITIAICTPGVCDIAIRMKKRV